MPRHKGSQDRKPRKYTPRGKDKQPRKPGSGRRATPEHLKTQSVTIRLPKYKIEALEKRGKIQPLIQQAIDAMFFDWQAEHAAAHAECLRTGEAQTVPFGTNATLTFLSPDEFEQRYGHFNLTPSPATPQDA